MQPPVIIEQRLPAPPAEVWGAITEIHQMRQWYFENIPAFAAEVGFSTQFNVQAPSRDFLHQWTVTEVVPGRKIVYDWSFAGLPGRGEVTFELWPDPAGTLLRLTNTGLESFPQDLPEFQRESCEAGWKYFIQERLRGYFEQ